MKEAEPIYNTLQRETGRTLNSIQVRSDVDQVSQLFWAVTLGLPVLFMFGSIFPPLSSIPVILGIWSIFSFVVSFPILYRKRRFPSAMVFLSFCRWLTELFAGDVRRRTTIAVFRKWTGDDERQYEKNVQLRETVEVWAKELIQLTIQEDWKGFHDNGEDYRKYLTTTIPGMSMYTLEHYWMNWCWYYGQIHSPDPLLRIVLANNTRQLADAIRELTGWRTLPATNTEVSAQAKSLSEHFKYHDLAPMVKAVYDAEAKRGWSYTTHSIEDLLGLLSKSMIIELNGKVIDNIFRVACRSAKQELHQGCQTSPYSDDIEKRIFQIADCIFRCIEHSILNGWKVLPAITSWYPAFGLNHSYGVITSKIILEINIGLSPSLTIQLLRQVLKHNLEVDIQKLLATLRTHFQTSDSRTLLWNELRGKAQSDYVGENKDSLAIRVSLELGFIEDIEQLFD